MEQKVNTYTFLEEYKEHIKPMLAGVDVFLKTSQYPLCLADVACVLGVDEEEVAAILEKIGATAIWQEVFLDVMERGSSWICKLYARERQIGSPPTYTASQIAYVYNLDEDVVKNVYQKMAIKEATSFTLPLIFAQIVIHSHIT